jgi:septal ring factor EnvC (AmiA/AmiB activator)
MAEIVDKALALIPKRGGKRKRTPALSAKRRAQITSARKNLAKLAADIAKLAKVIGSDIRNVARPAKKTAKKRTARPRKRAGAKRAGPAKSQGGGE